MVEHSPRNPDPNAPQNPPNSVANRSVRKTALRTYLLPLIAFVVLAALALVYWSAQPPRAERDANLIDRDNPNVAGTAGERGPDQDSPAGRDPQRTPDSTRDEVEDRGGDVVNELGALLDERALADAGRKVEVTDVNVDQVDSPTSFWVKDGSARVEVIAPAGSTPVRPGQQVDITGVAERSGEVLRIRASKIAVSK